MPLRATKNWNTKARRGDLFFSVFFVCLCEKSYKWCFPLQKVNGIKRLKRWNVLHLNHRLSIRISCSTCTPADCCMKMVVRYAPLSVIRVPMQYSEPVCWPAWISWNPLTGWVMKKFLNISTALLLEKLPLFSGRCICTVWSKNLPSWAELPDFIDATTSSIPVWATATVPISNITIAKERHFIRAINMGSLMTDISQVKKPWPAPHWYIFNEEVAEKLYLG